MRAKLVAGAEIDFMTREELRQEISPILSWLTEMRRGVKPLRFLASNQIMAGGTLLIGDSAVPSDQISPKPGYLWAVTRITVSGILATENTGLYLNATGSSNLLDTVPGQTLRRFGSNSLILLPEDRLIVSATGLSEAVGTNVVVTGAALEVPQEMAWKIF